jgi:hypothetical protein
VCLDFVCTRVILPVFVCTGVKVGGSVVRRIAKLDPLEGHGAGTAWMPPEP